MGLSISLEQEGDKWILRLKGNLNLQTHSGLQQELEKLWSGHHRKVLLDFANVASLSDDCLQMLLQWTKQFIGSQGNLGLINISEELMNEINRAGLHRLLLIYRDEQEALQAMT